MGPLTFVSGVKTWDGFLNPFHGFNGAADVRQRSSIAETTTEKTSEPASMGPLTFVSGVVPLTIRIRRRDRASMGPLTFVSGVSPLDLPPHLPTHASTRPLT